LWWKPDYKSAEKYVGSDELDVLILFPDGIAWEVHFDISVHLDRGSERLIILPLPLPP
jgi:hypothetical protein